MKLLFERMAAKCRTDDSQLFEETQIRVRCPKQLTLNMGIFSVGCLKQLTLKIKSYFCIG
jgi:hypothetical protein